MLIFILWVVCIIVATMVGSSKEKGGLGFVLGLLFGIIGVILIAVIPENKKIENK